MPFDMSWFFPNQKLWPSLKWLGGHDWLRVVPLPGFTSRMEIGTRMLREPQAARHHELLTGLFERSEGLSRKDRGDFITSLYIGSRAFAFGPKVFAPALDTCVALEQVDMNFPWSEFRLPYPSLIVEYPRAWVLRLRQAYGLRQTPAAAMIGQVGPDQVHLWVRHSEGGELHSIMTNRPERRSVEDIMGAHEEYGRLTAAAAGASPVSHGEQILKRVTVNLAVLLSHCGTKETGWADPEGRARHERKRGRRGATLALGDLVRVVPAEPIPLFTVTKFTAGSGPAVGTHNSPRPHWRRGHWRMQPVGEGRLARRQVFIAPAFVCGDNDQIDPGDYPVRYEGRS